MRAKHDDESIRNLTNNLRKGGADKYHRRNSERGKLFCRERIELLCDPGSFTEDGLFAGATADDLPADAVVTGFGLIEGRTVAVMASDSTVKAGSWGPRTVEKILRLQESVARRRVPLIYLVDSAGARITEQARMFPGRRGAGRIFFNQVELSGQVPQICLLFGPSAAGGAYIPAFCDVVFMVEGNAAMYLGSPRMVEMAVGEKVSSEDLGGAKMHATASGCCDFLCPDEPSAIEQAKAYLRFFPQSFEEKPSRVGSLPPAKKDRPLSKIVPAEQNKPFDMKELVSAVVDEGSFVEIKEKYAREIVTGLARIDGRAVGLVANQPRHRGGVLFIESAHKATRFISLCDAFNLPLVFFADVPGFMIGSQVERAGIIRAGARMISAVSEATVPKISVVVRKAYGAGLYAMCGPAFEPDATLALPTGMIAVMSPEAAVNAVFFNKIEATPESEREALVEELREEYARDVDLLEMANELVIDHVIPTERLREEMSRRLSQCEGSVETRPVKKRSVHPM